MLFRSHIDDLTTHAFKNDFMTFITQLTYAKQVMFKTTNKQNIFNENGRVVTNATYSFNVTFGVISKCNFSSIFGLSPMKRFLSPVICLEHPLSRYQGFFFIDFALNHCSPSYKYTIKHLFWVPTLSWVLDY